MTRRLILFVLGAILCAGRPAHAVEVPRAGPADPRIKQIDYDPQQVVRIEGAPRTATQILFGPDESILHVALGDTAAWEVAPERNVLFLKPTGRAAATNLIVTTELRGGGTRHYTFELDARSLGTRGRYFVLQFRYPQQEKAAIQAALSAEAQALNARILQLKLERTVLEGPRNLAYEVQGPAAVAPSEVTDNGRFTVLRFPGAQPLPAVYMVQADGAEALVPFDVRGEFLVIHQIAAQLRLRRGREVVCVFNLAFRPAGAPTGTATSAPDVVRTLPEGHRP